VNHAIHTSMKPGRIWHKPHIIIGLLILYYAVGTGLFLIQDTRPLFKFLTPLSLIMSFGAVLVVHKDWSWKLVIAFVMVFVTSFIVEIIGVRTGVLFGEYVYGRTLGAKVLDTPILIGLNWLLLVYCTSAVVHHFHLNKTAGLFSGAGLMVVYDGVLEYVAPVMDMWTWKTPYPGIRNFLMWFLLALLFHALFRVLHLHIENKPARYLFFIQFLFFCGMALHTFLTR
jgi:putative membrane protein